MLKIRILAGVCVLLSICTILQFILIRDLQEYRNKTMNYINNNERLWIKQTMFNREYYFSKKQIKRADAEWPTKYYDGGPRKK